MGKCSDLLRILKKNGWFVVSQKGSHIKMKHRSKPNLVIFPNHGSKEMAKGMEQSNSQKNWIKMRAICTRLL